MKVEGRRESSNIRDQRGGVGKKAAAGIGGGSVILAVIIYMLTGQNVAPQLAQTQAQSQQCVGAKGKELKDKDKILYLARQIWHDYLNRLFNKTNPKMAADAELRTYIVSSLKTLFSATPKVMHIRRANLRMKAS